ncbi:MAG: phosphate signaling complex protein PhoU [Chloroflexi bacterium]|nr:phosphate signaling complex protein PhoU [Chloroflexota bacterium]
MPRNEFGRDLRFLQEELLAVGSMVEKAIANAVDGLKRRDLDLCRQVVQDDSIIDARRYDIEERCVNLIAKQQPMATDLRTIIAILQIVGELERMGDYASGIAKISLAMGNEPPLKPLIDIPRMADKASQMLRRSLDSLVNRDIVAAAGVRADDDDVDALYDQIYRELLTFMLEDPRTITRATYLLWVAHDLERIADRATNIAKRVIYLVTGQHVETKNLASAGL